MSADMMPPEEPQEGADGTTIELPSEALNALIRVIRVCAENGAGLASQNPAEAHKLGQAALSYAQALVMLAPGRLQGGDTPEARMASVPSPPSMVDSDSDGQIGEQ